jgi:hypothetical protein
MFYFRVFFKCDQCNNISSRVVKISVRSKFDACEKVGKTFCHLCISREALELVEVEELELNHLEEFIQWTSINTLHVDILSSR